MIKIKEIKEQEVIFPLSDTLDGYYRRGGGVFLYIWNSSKDELKKYRYEAIVRDIYDGYIKLEIDFTEHADKVNNGEYQYIFNNEQGIILLGEYATDYENEDILTDKPTYNNSEKKIIYYE